MAVIAKHCPDYKVTVVDINSERIRQWQSDVLPISEPGLLEVVRECRGRNLFFSDAVSESIDEADIIFVSVNTPTKTFGHGAGKAADLQYWERTAREILYHSTTDKIVVEKSTLPVRTASTMQRILSANSDGIHFEVVSNPEFLSEGTAIQNLEDPDRILIGGMDTEEGRRAVSEIKRIYSRWVPEERIVTAGIWSSELSKLAANAFLAQRISSINSLSELCEKTEADVTEVARIIGMDPRIGPHFLHAGIGFGGSCFKKDILNLVYLCEAHGLSTPAEYWRLVLAMNEEQQDRFVANMIKQMFNTVAGKRIAVFGFAFKPDTDDTRESPAANICRALIEERAHIVVNDPRALDNAKRDLCGASGDITFEADPYRAVEGCDALAILTEWPVYRALDYERVYRAMRKPAFLFDGRACADKRRLFETGFNVFSIGSIPLTHM